MNTTTTTTPASSPSPVVASSASSEVKATSATAATSHTTSAAIERSQKVAILDAGAQYSKVIDRRVRELCVPSDILPLNTPAAQLRDYKAIIISGGPQSVYGKEAPQYDPLLFTLRRPLLGICYGMQLIAHTSSGRVEKGTTREDGTFEIVRTDTPSLLFDGLPAKFNVLLTHGDSVVALGPGFKATAHSSSGLLAACEDAVNQIYAVQFHPEVDLTQHGTELFRNFLYKIAGFSGNFTMKNRRLEAIEYVRRTVGDSSVLVLVSGGVDSSVCAALCRAALPADKVIALHIDSGFMRHGESALVKKALDDTGLNLKVIDASDTFYNATTLVSSSHGTDTSLSSSDTRPATAAESDCKLSEPLKHVVAPEIKRRIIGDTFIHVTEAAVASWGLDSRIFLAQGTLRPDLIESASNMASTNATVIKTHHNDTHLVRELRTKGRILEPLADYHKDEVRLLGLELGLPAELIWRQPFPGPGLAIRIICCKEAYITEHDHKITEELKTYSTDTISTTLLPCQTVGVQGDCRSYSAVVGLSCDGAPNWTQLLDIAKQIPKKVHGVNRVVYLFGERITRRAETTVTPTSLTPDCIRQLQLADKIVNEILFRYNLVKVLSQVPVILFPVDFGVAGARSICIRTFITNDFMTGIPATPGVELPTAALDEMVKLILRDVPGITRVAFDLTAKPPGTTEWE